MGDSGCAATAGTAALDFEEAVDVVDITMVDVDETVDSVDFADLVDSLDATPVWERCSGPSVSTFHLHLNQFYFHIGVPEKFSENGIVRLLSIIIGLLAVPCILCRAGKR